MSIEIAGYILGGLILLFIGAEFLVRASSSLGLKLGITPLVVGLTIVGYGTSTPELIVSVQAALQNQGDVAVGNIVGSNIANIGLILGISSMIMPLKIKAALNRYDMPVMIASALLLYFFSFQGVLNGVHGTVFLIGIAAYTWWIINKSKTIQESELAKEELEEVKPFFHSKTLDGITVVVSLAVLILGSYLFLEGSVALARYAGISEAVIGLTLIAVGTSLPEMATSIVAAIRGHADVAIGNIVGSNIYNILGILGLSAIVAPMAISHIGQRDYIVMLAFSIYLGYLGFTQGVLSRVNGFLLLVAYFVYVFILFKYPL